MDDGSTDGTTEALIDLPLAVLRNRRPVAWLSAGIDSRGSGIVTSDADGQHEPEEIPKLLAEAASHPDYVIIGVRHPDQRRAAKNRSFVFESEVLIEAIRSGHRSLAVLIKALRLSGSRPSYFRPVLDIARITCMVVWKLISKGMYPIGLYRALFGHTPRRRVSITILRWGYRIDVPNLHH